MFTVEISKPWCVFTHSIGNRCIYIGFDKTDRALNTNLIRDIAKWQDEVTANGGTINIAMFQQYDTREQAQDAWRQALQVLKPVCNIHRGQRSHIRQSRIQCMNDGNTFDSAAAAARSYGIAPSTMSNHLNGRQGYDTIHDRRFKRI